MKHTVFNLQGGRTACMILCMVCSEQLDRERFHYGGTDMFSTWCAASSWTVKDFTMEVQTYIQYIVCSYSSWTVRDFTIEVQTCLVHGVP